MGMPTIITEALIGVVKFNPSKNIIWLRPTPKKEIKPNLIKSFLATFSPKPKTLTSQKTADAPATLKK